MSKILVVLGHPDAQSFNAEIFKTFVENLNHEKHEVQTLNLGEMKFDPVLRFGYREFMPPDDEISRSQELVKWAEKIIFIYPIWWASMPSLMKGWLDRVMTPGFAYHHEKLGMKGLLNSSAELWLTCDAPTIYYKLLVRTPVNLMKKNILKSCGIKVARVEIFGNTRGSSPEQRNDWLGKVTKVAKEEK